MDDINTDKLQDLIAAWNILNAALIESICAPHAIQVFVLHARETIDKRINEILREK